MQPGNNDSALPYQLPATKAIVKSVIIRIHPNVRRHLFNSLPHCPPLTETKLCGRARGRLQSDRRPGSRRVIEFISIIRGGIARGLPLFELMALI